MLNILRSGGCIKREDEDRWIPVDMENDPDLEYVPLEEDRTLNGVGYTNDQIINAMMIGARTCVGTDQERLDLDTLLHSTHMSTVDMKKKHPTAALSRSGDVLDTRFVLRIPLSLYGREHVADLLHDIRNVALTLIIGGTRLYEIPSMLVNLILLDSIGAERYGNAGGIFNLAEWYESVDPDEALAYVIRHGEFVTTRYNKYTAWNANDTYLDIPLMFDFFSYGGELPVIALQYHTIDIEFHGLTLEQLKPYVPSVFKVGVYPEKTVNYNTNERGVLARAERRETVTITCDTYPSFDRTVVETYGAISTKFFFVTVESLDRDVCTFGLPDIIEAQVDHGGPWCQAGVELDPTMFYIADYDKRIRLYVISPDPEQDMRKWTDAYEEFAGTDHKQGMHTVSSNMDGAEVKYIPRNIERLRLTFSDMSPDIVVKVSVIKQNVLSMAIGMAGLIHSQ